MLDQSSSEGEKFTATIVGFIALGSAVGAIAVLWSGAVAWLREHQVLTAGDTVLISMPAAPGIGLDIPRLAILAAAIAAAIAFGISALRRRQLLQAQVQR